MTDGGDRPQEVGNNQPAQGKPVQKTSPDIKFISMLGKTFEPFFAKYADVEKSKLALEEKVIGHEADQARRTFWGAVILGGVTLVFAGVLFVKDRDDAGMKLISVVAGIAGAAFGGYGIGKSRKRSRADDE